MEFLALLIWLLLAGTGAILAPFAFTLPGSGGEVLQAGVVGLQGPFYCALTFVTLLVALQVTDPVV